MRLWEPKRKCPKAIPTHLQNHVVWSWTLKCSVKSYVTGPSTECYFNEFLFIMILTHDKIEQINSCEHPEFHGLPVLCWPYLREVDVFEKCPSDHETWSIWCHAWFCVDFTSILHSPTLLTPQAKCEANLDRLHLSHHWECLRCDGHGLSISWVRGP